MSNNKESMQYISPDWLNLSKSGYDNTTFMDFDVINNLDIKELTSMINIHNYPTLICFKLPNYIFKVMNQSKSLDMNQSIAILKEKYV